MPQKRIQNNPLKKKIQALPATERLAHFQRMLGASKKFNYMTGGAKFIENFKHSLYRRRHTFLVDLRKSLFETPLSVAVLMNKGRDRKVGKEDMLFEARLAFSGKTVIVKAFQGYRGKTSEIKEFEEVVKTPIANYIIKEIEDQSRALGYKQVKIIMPRGLEAYHDPNFYTSLRYRAKTLSNEKLIRNLTPAENREFQSLLNIERNKVKQRIEKLYYSVAMGLEYKSEGNYFVKKL
ncbi:MAG: hypothetical protein AABW59_02710 [archaeon]